jgi:hypothetical protein
MENKEAPLIVGAGSPSEQHHENLQGQQMESVQLQEIPGGDQVEPNQTQMVPVQDQTLETEEKPAQQNSAPETSSMPQTLEVQLAQLSLKEKGMMNSTLRKFF